MPRASPTRRVAFNVNLHEPEPRTTAEGLTVEVASPR
jgi:hypothetical protein